jgi:glucan biosynthesis protein
MEYNVNESPDLHLKVEKENTLKSWLVDYVGKQLDPENDEVNVEMIIEVMANEFPEFLLPIAEENFIRGYRQAMSDIKSVGKTKEEA